MSNAPRFKRLFRLRRRGAADLATEVDDEIDTHLALRARELERYGMSPSEAWAEALRRFGDLPDAKRRLRESARMRETALHRRGVFDGLRHDLRIALRQARRSPTFTTLALLTLALGIGATTAVFTLVDHALLRPLPFSEPDRLVSLFGRDSLGRTISRVSAGNWWDWRERTTTLEDIAIHQDASATMLVDGVAERVAAQEVSGNFFEVLRPRMIVGVGFTDAQIAEDRQLAVVSEGYWRSVLGAPPRLDVPVRIFGRPVRIAGVIAAGHEYPAGSDVWLPGSPMGMSRGTGMLRNYINYTAIGRLAPGVTIERARAEMDAIARAITASDPASLYAYGMVVSPMQDVIVGGSRDYLHLLLGAVALVLLIACANLASANLARGAGRSRELAIRAALGAGRGRLVRQLMVEHLLLALAGGAAGVLLAHWIVRLMLTAARGQLPRWNEVAIDGRILAFAILVSVLAAVLSGLLPTLRLSRVPLRDAMAQGGRGAVGPRRLTGSLLVGGQVALALVLLTGAGLLIRSFRTLTSRDLGFAVQEIVAAELTLEGTSIAQERSRSDAFWGDLVSSIGAAPGVLAAGAANRVPLGRGGSTFLEIQGRDEPGAGASYRVVTDGYFAALGVPHLAGRPFDATDRMGSERVALVNRRMAERYWPGRSPIGERVRATTMEGGPARAAPWVTIVGVVADFRHWGYDDEAQEEMYALYRQVPFPATTMTVVARGTMPPDQLVRLMRAEIRARDPTIAAEVGRFTERRRALLAERTFPMFVLTGFGALALTIAGVGLYAVLSYTVAQRTRELAVRTALGADRGNLMGLVLSQAARVLATGSLCGIIGAAYVSRALDALLVETSPRDALTFTAATVVLFGIGLLAASVPAWRATRISPMIALQGD